MSAHQYSFAALKNAVEHALGGTPDSRTSSGDIVNDALAALAAMRPWQWRKRTAILRTSAKSITSVSRTSSVVTVTCPSHGVSAGDDVEIADVNDSSFNGRFVVATSPDSSTFTYYQDKSNATSTGGTCTPLALALPNDFSSLLSVVRQQTPTRCRPCALETILRARRDNLEFPPDPYIVWYAVRHDAAGNWKLEMWPYPASGTSIIIEYLMMPRALAQDDDVPDIPPAFMPALKRLCRALAVAEEDEQQGPDWLLFNQMVATLVAEDGAVQPIIGPAEGAVSPSADDYLYPEKISME